MVQRWNWSKSNKALVAYGLKYAKEKEYSVDELGILALHTRIEDRQTSDHAVDVEEVRAIVDEAIRHAEKKSVKHFFDVLFAKRYDEEDMITCESRISCTKKLQKRKDKTCCRPWEETGLRNIEENCVRKFLDRKKYYCSQTIFRKA